jgi:uncharacterized membrane protein HdeD (DUF308 family)
MAESASGGRKGAAGKKRAAKRSASSPKRAAKRSAKASAKRSASPKRAATRSAEPAAKRSASSAAARPSRAEVQAVEGLSKFWWLWLLFGLVWIAVSVVILQFDEASITTVGVIIGAMFLGASVQNFALAGLEERGKWVFGIFGVLFLAAAVIAFISPEDTFAAIADVLGFLFLLVGVFWIIEAFMARGVNELWWLGLTGGILMVILAFYTGGQFFIEKAYVLLVFAGIWSLMEGVINITRAFQIRKLGRLVSQNA